MEGALISSAQGQSGERLGGEQYRSDCPCALDIRAPSISRESAIYELRIRSRGAGVAGRACVYWPAPTLDGAVPLSRLESRYGDRFVWLGRGRNSGGPLQ